MSKLVINELEITTDSSGRYSLNDLHKAAGGSIKHLPNKFMRSNSFGEVVDVLIAQKRAFEPVVKKQGRYTGGTWVCKELVYKYAMWVNAEFEIRVIQTFDSIVNRLNAPSSMIALNELTAKIESDKHVASVCGRELAKYKQVRKENEQLFLDEVNQAQFTLGFAKEIK
tara:strand:+ start:125 stop:631 length:507 start_codon:yes stop_codon:yes gene_type:complete